MEDVRITPKNNGWAWVALIDGVKVGSGFTFASEADAYARGLACIAEHKYDGMDNPMGCPACGSESGWNGQMCCDCGWEKESKMKTAMYADTFEYGFIDANGDFRGGEVHIDNEEGFWICEVYGINGDDFDGFGSADTYRDAVKYALKDTGLPLAESEYTDLVEHIEFMMDEQRWSRSQDADGIDEWYAYASKKTAGRWERGDDFSGSGRATWRKDYSNHYIGKIIQYGENEFEWSLWYDHLVADGIEWNLKDARQECDSAYKRLSIIASRKQGKYVLEDTHGAPQCDPEVHEFDEYWELDEYLDNNPDVMERIDEGYAWVREASEKQALLTGEDAIEAGRTAKIRWNRIVLDSAVSVDNELVELCVSIDPWGKASGLYIDVDGDDFHRPGTDEQGWPENMEKAFEEIVQLGSEEVRRRHLSASEKTVSKKTAEDWFSRMMDIAELVGCDIVLEEVCRIVSTDQLADICQTIERNLDIQLNEHYSASKKQSADYGQHGVVERYRTNFELEYPVTDLNAAQRYLSADDMTEYLVNDSDIPQETRDAIISIDWILTNEYEGYVELLSQRELEQSELDAISEWVGGQNSDGLGEGFEQQDFAEYLDGQYDIDMRYWEEQEPDRGDFEDEEEYEDALAYWEEDAPDEWDYYVMCSFDWKTNDYRFRHASLRTAYTQTVSDDGDFAVGDMVDIAGIWAEITEIDGNSLFLECVEGDDSDFPVWVESYELRADLEADGLWDIDE